MPDLTPFTLTSAAGGLPSLPAGIDTTMTLTVTNRWDADISLLEGATQLILTLPDVLFSSDEIAAMAPAGPAGWGGATAGDASAVTFTCSGAGTWRQGDTLTFAIGRMRSASSPQIAQVTLTPQLSAGNALPDVNRTLTLTAATAGGQPKLPLAATVSGGGVVYCSSASDPLVNSLELTLTNTFRDRPVYTASTAAGTPRIIISFVYGTIAGALAPDKWTGPTPPGDSAYSIKATQPVREAYWTLSTAGPPNWILEPAGGNVSLFGAADTATASLTVRFDGIRSFSEPGHTQLIVLCTGFLQDENTPYEDAVLVVDLTKADPPATRGLVGFGSPDHPVVQVSQPGTQLDLSLQWTMYGGVKNVLLTTSAPSVAPVTVGYPDAPMLKSDGYTLRVPAPAEGGPVIVTLQAYAGSGTPGALGSFLNQAQFTMFVQALYAVDPDGKVYPARQFGTALWMIADYDYAPSGDLDSSAYPGSLDGPAGRYYTWEAARTYAPQGWVLPTAEDWNALASEQPQGSALVYAGPGGQGFDAVLGGFYNPSGESQYQDQGSVGYYWTSARQIPVQVSQGSPPVQVLTGGLGSDTQVAVRYVRRL